MYRLGSFSAARLLAYPRLRVARLHGVVAAAQQPLDPRNDPRRYNPRPQTSVTPSRREEQPRRDEQPRREEQSRRDTQPRREQRSVGEAAGDVVKANVDGAIDVAADFTQAVGDGLEESGRRTERRFDEAGRRFNEVGQQVEEQFDAATDRVASVADNIEESASRSSQPQTRQDWGTTSQTSIPPLTSMTVDLESAPGSGGDSRFKDGDIKKVLVAGAAGGVGSKIVAQLAAKGVHVIALARNVEKARSRLPWPSENITVLEGDVYKYSTLPRALQGCDAVICATGASDPLDPLGPFNIDFSGTVNLVAASQAAGVKRFVYVTSIGADDPIINPLNLFWGVLFWKKRAEEYLQRSGLEYTIVRPGGLVSDGGEGGRGMSSASRGQGNVVLAPAGTYGIPPKKMAGSIKRSKVAECCVEALVQPTAVNKVVEVISDSSAPMLSWEYLFEGVQF